MSDTNYTAFNAMVDIVASPAKALENVKDHTSWLWYPLLISVALASAVFAYYYSWVDFEWIIDETIRSIPAEDRAEAEPGIRGFMSPTSSIVTTVLAIVIMTFVIYAIQAAYLHLANKITTGADIRYGQWFSFSAWTAFVGVFNTLAVIVIIFTADNNQVSQAELAPLSMNALFINAEMGDPWFTWGNSLTLVNLWMLVLMSIGYKVWTGASMAKSAIIACLPWVLIFGIWAATI